MRRSILYPALVLGLAGSAGLLYNARHSHIKPQETHPVTYSRSIESTTQEVVQDAAQTSNVEQTSTSPQEQEPNILEEKVKPQESQVDIHSLIRETAEKEGVPFEILDSLVWKESSYNPIAENKISHARGLTQLMPNTAKLYGVANPFDAQENLRGGASYLKWLYGKFTAKSRSNSERWKFALASYNAGLGHIEDAMQAARRNEVGTLYWDNVARLLQTSDSNKEETINYVDAICARANVR